MYRLLKTQGGAGLGAGLTIGLLLSYRPWIIFAAGVIVGALLVGAARAARDLTAGFRLWRRQAEARHERIRSTPVPHYSRRKGQSDEIPF